MIPVIALVGRPNVGKSTLFNRLTKSRNALVANLSGLTRDRQYGESHYMDRHFMVIDTGGISGDEEGIDSAMADQSLLAIEEADVVLFIVDSKAGLTPADDMIAKHLRKTSKKTYLVANKIDGVDVDVALSDFYALGLGEIHPTTATHGRGVRSLMEAVLKDIPEDKESENVILARGTRIGIIGRPNVGKSTLVNRMLGEDRVVVYDQPGTTRDSIYIEYERDGQPYTIIDTAGIRRRKNITEAVEKFSIVKTLQAISDSHVVILLLDAREGIVDQDLHLMGTVINSGRALVVALNKWDGMTQDDKDFVKKELDRRLRFIDYVDIHYISALHGSGVGKLYGSIEEAYRSATEKFQTRKLTQLLEDAIQDHQPPLINGRRIKLRYAHLGGSNPPVIVIHGNQTDKIPGSYTKYLEKVFRRELKLVGTPVKIEFKGSENPYAGRKNKLTERQASKKERFAKQLKKAKNKKKNK